MKTFFLLLSHIALLGGLFLNAEAAMDVDHGDGDHHGPVAQAAAAAPQSQMPQGVDGPDSRLLAEYYIRHHPDRADSFIDGLFEPTPLMKNCVGAHPFTGDPKDWPLKNWEAAVDILRHQWTTAQKPSAAFFMAKIFANIGFYPATPRFEPELPNLQNFRDEVLHMLDVVLAMPKEETKPATYFHAALWKAIVCMDGYKKGVWGPRLDNPLTLYDEGNEEWLERFREAWTLLKEAKKLRRRHTLSKTEALWRSLIIAEMGLRPFPVPAGADREAVHQQHARELLAFYKGVKHREHGGGHAPHHQPAEAPRQTRGHMDYKNTDGAEELVARVENALAAMNPPHAAAAQQGPQDGDDDDDDSQGGDEGNENPAQGGGGAEYAADAPPYGSDGEEEAEAAAEADGAPMEEEGVASDSDDDTMPTKRGNHVVSSDEDEESPPAAAADSAPMEVDDTDVIPGKRKKRRVIKSDDADTEEASMSEKEVKEAVQAVLGIMKRHLATTKFDGVMSLLDILRNQKHITEEVTEKYKKDRKFINKLRTEVKRDPNYTIKTRAPKADYECFIKRGLDFIRENLEAFKKEYNFRLLTGVSMERSKCHPFRWVQEKIKNTKKENPIKDIEALTKDQKKTLYQCFIEALKEEKLLPEKAGISFTDQVKIFWEQLSPEAQTKVLAAQHKRTEFNVQLIAHNLQFDKKFTHPDVLRDENSLFKNKQEDTINKILDHIANDQKRKQAGNGGAGVHNHRKRKMNSASGPEATKSTQPRKKGKKK